MYSVLDDPLFLLDTSSGTVAGTLPDALAGLCAGTVTGFDGLAAHQRPGWDLFCYQLGGLALSRAGVATDDGAWPALTDPADWRAWLAALTPDEGAWSLVVEDVRRPAFLQAPIMAGTLDPYDLAGEAPDAIDVLVTAKDHDVKLARAWAAEPRHWAFALVSLQTMQGYSGRGNFGIARMNGGFASRPLLMRTPHRDSATCFRRGVQAAIAARDKALGAQHRLFDGDGIGLLWLEPWDGDDSLSTQQLDPLVIEICRRLRLTRNAAGRIAAVSRPSPAARIEAKQFKGDLGDAWTPISRAENTALTVGAGGFDYRLLTRLFDETTFALPVAAQPRRDDPTAMMWLRAAVLVRGQGKTEGLHERWIGLPGRAAPDTLGALSKGMAQDAKDARQALFFGLLTFVQGAPEKLDFKDQRISAWLDAFEQRVDDVFFVHLFHRADAAEATEAAAETAWTAGLVGIARTLFHEAVRQLDPPGNRRERALALAGPAFDGALRKAGLLPPPKDEEGSAP